MSLRTATGATRGTRHRPVTPELDKERRSAASAAPGTAGFCPGPPKRRAQGRSLHWGTKTQWFTKRNKGQRPSSSGLSGVSREPSLGLGGLGNGFLSHRLQDGRSCEWLGGQWGTERNCTRASPSRLHPGSPVLFLHSCSWETPNYSGVLGDCWSFSLGLQRERLSLVPCPRMLSTAYRGERWGSEKGMGADESLGTSSLSPRSDHNPNIPASLQKEKTGIKQNKQFLNT